MMFSLLLNEQKKIHKHLRHPELAADYLILFCYVLFSFSSGKCASLMENALTFCDFCHLYVFFRYPSKGE